jgi:translation initiation factor IF-3
VHTRATFQKVRDKKIRKNGDLRGTPRVEVIGASGNKLGVMTLAEALRLAVKEGLDLVEVNPRVSPPVCKLLDFDKYKYEAAKQAAQAKRNGDGDLEPQASASIL